MVVAVDDVVVQTLVKLAVVAISTYGVELQFNVEELIGKMTGARQSNSVVTCHLSITHIRVLVRRLRHPCIVIVQ